MRLDKIDPVISGNKWFKLKHYLQAALRQGQTRVLTFGGAYSNHIIATACTARKAGLASIGIIRGEKPASLSPTLLDAAQCGMELVFVSRAVYNQKNDPAFIEQLRQEYDNPYVIPEGGGGIEGRKGAAEILQLADTGKYNQLVCAVGTGTVLAGLAMGSGKAQQLTGVAVLKGFENWLPQAVTIQEQQRIKVLSGYHFGGYAKKNQVLFDFMNDWYSKTGVPSDFVYTGKLFFAVNDLIKKGYFPGNSRILVIHSGGLQGNKSLPLKTLDF